METLRQNQRKGYHPGESCPSWECACAEKGAGETQGKSLYSPLNFVNKSTTALKLTLKYKIYQIRKKFKYYNSKEKTYTLKAWGHKTEFKQN